MCYITLVKPAMDCLWLGQIGGECFRDDRLARETGGVCQNLYLPKICIHPKFMPTSFFLKYHRQLQADVATTTW